jgi:hypothetical protein
MKTAVRFSLVFLLFLVAACVPLSVKTVEVASSTAVPAATETALPTLEAGITLQQLQNMSYLSPNTGMSVQLTNGIYTEDSTSISLLPQIAIGDLNEDGVDDAAVLLGENTGGTGDFIFLVVIISQGGELTQAANQFIDDRPIIQSLEIADGAIMLNATIHGINDPMVSPTLQVKQTYKLLENNLSLMSQNSTIEGGSERSIVFPCVQRLRRFRRRRSLAGRGAVGRRGRFGGVRIGRRFDGGIRWIRSFRRVFRRGRFGLRLLTVQLVFQRIIQRIDRAAAGGESGCQGKHGQKENRFGQNFFMGALFRAARFHVPDSSRFSY